MGVLCSRSACDELPKGLLASGDELIEFFLKKIHEINVRRIGINILLVG